MKTMNILSVFLRPAACAGLVVLTGCAASDATRYYSLQQPVQALSQSAASSPRAAAPAYVISVQPVSVPEQVDRLQIVVTDPASTQVYPLDSYVWVAPLAQEFRTALSAALQAQLNTLDIDLTQLPEGRPAWKVLSQVQRFESIYDTHVALEVTWALEPLNQPAQVSHLCGARVILPVKNGVSALVAGHREALNRVAQTMARHLQAQGRAFNAVEGVELVSCS